MLQVGGGLATDKTSQTAVWQLAGLGLAASERGSTGGWLLSSWPFLFCEDVVFYVHAAIKQVRFKWLLKKMKAEQV